MSDSRGGAPATPDLLEVADILTWKRVSPIPLLWRARYDRLLESRIEALCSGADGDRCIVESLRLLPAARRSRFLRAPEVAARLVSPREGEALDGGFIAMSLLAELATAGTVGELPSALWTAHGDRCLDPGAPQAWRDDEASFVEAAPVIDDRGPVVYDFGTSGDDVLVLPSDAERLRVRDRISAALGAIRATSEGAFRLGADCVGVIAVRTTAEPSPRLSSSSYSKHAGLTLITNGHLDSVDLPQMADALVHESIHSLLFLYEAVEGPFVKLDAAPVKVRSPWTKVELFIPAYVHACVVWYGLSCFWKAASAMGVFPAQRCQELLNRARAGFDSRPFSHVLAPFTQLLSAPVASLLREVEASMVAR